MSNTDELREAATDALRIFDWLERRSIYGDTDMATVHANLRAALAQQPAASGEPVAWHCPRDPDSATAFFWRRPMNGLCPNCVKPLVPVVLAAAPGAPDAPSESNTQR